jgi:hypothetical protein
MGFSSIQKTASTGSSATGALVGGTFVGAGSHQPTDTLQNRPTGAILPFILHLSSNRRKHGSYGISKKYYNAPRKGAAFSIPGTQFP